jgi:hypothetical protein
MGLGGAAVVSERANQGIGQRNTASGHAAFGRVGVHQVVAIRRQNAAAIAVYALPASADWLRFVVEGNNTVHERDRPITKIVKSTPGSISIKVVVRKIANDGRVGYRDHGAVPVVYAAPKCIRTVPAQGRIRKV